MSSMDSGTVSGRARRRFSEFTTGAVRLVLDEGKTVGAMSRELRVAMPLGMMGDAP